MIHKKHRAFFFYALLIVASVVVCCASTYSASYEACRQERDSSNAGQADVGRSVAYFFVCEGVVLDVNGDLITALATVFVAFFTWTLYRATTTQGEISQQSIDLSREEFRATHRPKVRVRAVGFAAAQTDANKFAIKFTCINVGELPCEIANVRVRLDRAENANAPLYRMNFDIVEIDQPRVLVSGDAISFTSKIYEGRDLTELGPRWDVYGFVSYTDGAGVQRRTGFWRRYDSPTNTWSAPENPDWNYEY